MVSGREGATAPLLRRYETNGTGQKLCDKPAYFSPKHGSREELFTATFRGMLEWYSYELLASVRSIGKCVMWHVFYIEGLC